MKFESNLKKEYNKKFRSELMKDLKIGNIMAVPTLEKIVVNVGIGEMKENNTLLELVLDDIAKITGQKPVVTMSKKAISNFKIRENMPVGVKVTLRGNMMWHFIEKLINIALPRVKDFRGVSGKSFDGRGNYSIGFNDQMIFPEIDSTKVMTIHGLQVIINTTATTNDGGYALLEKFGMPFRK